MDLGSVLACALAQDAKKGAGSGTSRRYLSADHLLSDVALTWHNCRLYNPPEHEVNVACRELGVHFDQLWTKARLAGSSLTYVSREPTQADIAEKKGQQLPTKTKPKTHTAIARLTGVKKGAGRGGGRGDGAKGAGTKKAVPGSSRVPLDGEVMRGLSLDDSCQLSMENPIRSSDVAAGPDGSAGLETGRKVTGAEIRNDEKGVGQQHQTLSLPPAKGAPTATEAGAKAGTTTPGLGTGIGETGAGMGTVKVKAQTKVIGTPAGTGTGAGASKASTKGPRLGTAKSKALAKKSGTVQGAGGTDATTGTGTAKGLGTTQRVGTAKGLGAAKGAGIGDALKRAPSPLLHGVTVPKKPRGSAPVPVTVGMESREELSDLGLGP